VAASIPSRASSSFPSISICEKKDERKEGRKEGSGGVIK